MIEVGIIGGTGYAGAELLRLFVAHPQVRVALVTSRGEAGRRVDDLFPHLRGFCELSFEAPSSERLAQCDAVFFATPHGTAMEMAPELLRAGVKIVDISADFRLKDPALWQQWYGQPHACPELLEEAVYGLPERNRAAIREARLVANPGCYPAAIELGLLPLLEQGLVEPASLIADAKTGSSGAGRQAGARFLHGEVTDSFKAYGAGGHRHLPETRALLQSVTDERVGLIFVPHLVPMVRGIHATLYARLRAPETDVQALFEGRYGNEPFVDVMPPGSHPETRSVRGSNDCRLALHRPGGGDTVVVLSVIDNLVKGASGQAVQNFNIMFGLEERTGLAAPALLP
jgi:N-acetyl-gamma-glutamyl-phosphate reductase